jgi:ribokinase
VPGSAQSSAAHPGPAQRQRVLVLGDVMTDVVARIDDPLALGSDTAAQVRTRVGGAGANVAAWLGRHGTPVTFVGCVGDDPFGERAVAVLQAAGVRTEVAVHPGTATGTVVVLVGPDGERTMLPDAGANSRLTPELLHQALACVGAAPSGAGGAPEGAPGAAAWLHLSGYTLLNPGSRAAGLAALAAAHEAGVPTSVDAASTAPLETLGGAQFLRLSADVDLAFCTVDEAEVLTGTRDPDVALARLTATYPEVVLKLGPSGARWSGRDDPRGISSPAVEPAGPVVDSTGAGDAFAAAFLAARLGGTDVRSALTEACRAAAAQVAAR